MNRLARMASGHARRVLLIAGIFFVVAGALGAGVADRLDPYGADDPDTESVIADQRLEDAGYRETGVVVLVRGEGAGRARSIAALRRDPDVASVTRPVRSRDGGASYVAAALKPTDDDERQDAAERIADELGGRPGVTVGGPAVAQKEVNEQVEQRPAHRRAVRVPAAVPALAALLPQPRRGAAAAARRARSRSSARS